MLPHCLGVLSLVALGAFAVDVSQQQQCGQNEVFVQCHNQFPPTCADQKPQSFPVPCKPGCNCANGYIRESSASGAKCIPVNQCPTGAGSSSPSPTGGNIKCGPNEVEKSCPTPVACAKTCQNYKQSGNSPCNQPCPVKGCECKPGYVRQQAGNVCIREQDCAFVTGPPSLTTASSVGGGEGQCKAPSEVFAQCHNQFPPTCVEKNPSAFPVPCKPGCNCANGYIKKDSSANAPCVPVNQCQAGVKCGPNEEFKSCPTPVQCAKTCQNMKELQQKCNTPCPSVGCQCKAGYVRQQGGNVCIREQDCAFVTGPPGVPTQPPFGATTEGGNADNGRGAHRTHGPPLNCGANEVLKRKHECPKAPECEAQCVQGNVKQSSCKKCHTAQRCECQEGYVRQMDHGAKICISNDDCQFNKGPQSS